MIGVPIPPSPLPDVQYATFSDEINEQTASKFVHWMDLISLDAHPRHDAVHILFNSSGGMIVDAINLHHYVKGYPSDIPITMFNTGGVQSAAVLVFLSASHRVICRYSKFLLHPATWKAGGLNSEQLRIVSRSLGKNDKDIDEILRTRIKMPEAKWKQARRHQLEISPEEAIEFGFADEIGEWSVPQGKGVISLSQTIAK